VVCIIYISGALVNFCCQRNYWGVILLSIFLPSIDLGGRRLHDTNRSGWWQLIYIILLIGLIVMIIFLVQEGETIGNQYGEPPIIDYSE
jgi:uncharacterized membrane protein YhaH (DUF805 family)